MPGPYLVVQTIGAVKDHTLDGESFCKVFGSLSFPRASRTSWCASQVELQSPHEAKVAAILKKFIKLSLLKGTDSGHKFISPFLSIAGGSLFFYERFYSN